MNNGVEEHWQEKTPATVQVTWVGTHVKVPRQDSSQHGVRMDHFWNMEYV